MRKVSTLTAGVAALACLSFASPAAPQARPRNQTCDRTVRANVMALDQVIVLNRLGSTLPGGMIYALARDVVSTSNGASCNFDVTDPNAKTSCQPGAVKLRDGKRARPIVLRANEGDCLEITFTNLLAPSTSSSVPGTRTASLHVQGMPWVKGSQDDASNIGSNKNSNAVPGEKKVYTLYAEHEGSNFLYSTPDDWTNVNAGDGGALAQGLFGAVNIQPSGFLDNQAWYSEWFRSQVTEQDLCLASADMHYDAQSGCTRAHPGDLPVIRYDAVYPAGHPRQFLPILNMLCTPQGVQNGACKENELIYSDLTAVITGPMKPPTNGRYPDFPSNFEPPSLRPVYVSPDRLQPYREFTIIYHESFLVSQAFNTGVPTSLAAAQDNFGINYGMAGLTNEVLSNRLDVGPVANCVDCKYEEFFLSSWALGDPDMVVDTPASSCMNPAGSATGTVKPGCQATKALYPDDPSNVYHGYMSDHVKFRVLHAGPDLHHLHHQHAHQWLGTPNSPNGDYLDSQSIGPASSFTMEMVYNGSGNVNQAVGDSIFHCHFYPHFASGMWALWRVHDVFERGTYMGANGMVAAGRPNRALPDAEIVTGTPTPALVPMPTLPMAPAPAEVQLSAQRLCSNNLSQSCQNDGDCGAGNQCIAKGSQYCVVVKNPGTGEEQCLSALTQTDLTWDQLKDYQNPGYPFFIPGVAGTRAPHPPMDFAHTCRNNNEKICSPADPSSCSAAEGPCEPLDGGLPRNVTLRGSQQNWTVPPLNNTDFSKEIETATGIRLPEEGTLVEKIAMAANAERYHFTQLPDGRKTGVCSDNRAPCSGDTLKDKQQCADPPRAVCVADMQINFVLNGLPPKAGAPYADPCILFRREGGVPRNLLHRQYLAVDIQLDAIFNKAGWHFPQQRILSLWGDAKATIDKQRTPEPLFLRANSYDCVDYIQANLVPNVYELDDFQVRTPTDIIGQHIHLVKFDVTSSDGSANGWNYEDGTFGPNEVTERIHALNSGGGLLPPPGGTGTPDKNLEAKPIPYFGPGPGGAWIGAQATVQRWYSDPLFNNQGRCSTDLTKACNLDEMKSGYDIAGSGCPSNGLCVTSAGTCSDNGAPCTDVDLNQCGDKNTAQCNPFFDRTIRTIFTHDHFGPSTHQQAGLYAGLVAEPKDSLWRDNQTGEIFGGYDPATKNVVKKRFDGGPTSWQAVIDGPNTDNTFREFLLQVQDSTLMYQPFTVGANPFADQRPGVCAGAAPDEPCGFCSYNGVCVSSTTGQLVPSESSPTQCLVAAPGVADGTDCPSGSRCLLRLGNLTPCTPRNLTACKSSSTSIASCNFVPGVPSTSWQSGNFFETKYQGIEAITFNNSTYNFSYNYRSEPLFPRTTNAATGKGSGIQGDLGFAYLSAAGFCKNAPRQVCNQDADCGTNGPCNGRPNPRGKVCTTNLTRQCTADTDCANSGQCQEAGFCSDNWAICTTAAKGLCKSTGADCRTASNAFPYPPLTAGVEENDPFTPLLRVYAGDDVQLRPLIGAHINPHNFTIHGLSWLREPSFVDSGWRNSDVMGISEHFELITRVPPPYTRDAKRDWTDFLYQPGAAGIEQAGGNWGLLRSYNTKRDDLYELKQNKVPAGGVATAPVCPADAPRRSYTVVALTAQQALGGALTYNSNPSMTDPSAILFFNTKGPDLKCADPADPSTCAIPIQLQCNQGKCSNNDQRSCTSASDCFVEPVVLRAAAGDCIQVKLYNGINPTASGFSQTGLPITPALAPANCALSNAQGTNCGGKGQPPCCNGQLGCVIANSNKNTNPVTQPTNCGGSGQPPCCTTNNPANCLTGNGAVGGNPKPTNCGGKLPACCSAAPSKMSVEVGLRPQMVTYDLRASDGTNAGFNPVQTIGTCGTGGTSIPTCSSTTYTWYAGHINRDSKTGAVEHIPVEFGASNLLSPDAVNQYVHGLFGGLVIEPKGATFDEGAGSSAVVTYTDDTRPIPIQRRFRDFVVFMQDDSNNLPGKNNAVNYRSQTLLNALGGDNGQTPPRYCGPTCPADGTDVSCMLAGKSFQQSGSTCAQTAFTPATPIFQACTGESVRFRLMHGGGTNTDNVFELSGHNFSEQPYMTRREFCDPPLNSTNYHASSILGTENLCANREFTGPRAALDNSGLWRASLNEWRGSRQGHGPSNHFDVLVEEAGGPFKVPGDYLYRSAPAMHYNLGLWGLFRVVDRQSPPSGFACIPGAGDLHDFRFMAPEDEPSAPPPPPPPAGQTTGTGSTERR
ncbi:MAG TPA: hypothetical protein VHC97_13800 [Thermoanaerobaculia bacterium]|jgi:hypothetical protein|nr:hypothetical protein [Thermoanaerobaculia bacterium]